MLKNLIESIHHLSVWLVVVASIAQLVPAIPWELTRIIWFTGLIIFIIFNFRLNKIPTITAIGLGSAILLIFLIPFPLPNSIPLLIQLALKLVISMTPIIIILTSALYAIKISRHNKLTYQSSTSD